MKKIFLFSVFIQSILISANAQFIGQNNVMGAGGNFSQYLNKTLLKTTTEGVGKEAVVNSFNNTENTKGARFLFDTWVKGDSVIDAGGNIINTVSFIFNFDKMTGNLLATQDKINIMSVAPIGINSFVLEDKGRKYIFEHVAAIDSLKFFLALVKSDTRYSLYKRFVTKFIASNFRNDGVMQTGNQYDEYKDESQYYIIEPGATSAKVVSLKPKGIKAALEMQKEKTDAYFKQHKEDVIDERFLSGLINSLNE